MCHRESEISRLLVPCMAAPKTLLTNQLCLFNTESMFGCLSNVTLLIYETNYDITIDSFTPAWCL